MPETAGATPPDDNIPKALRRKSQNRLVWIAVSGSTNNALLTSIVPLFLLSLGASPFLIGLVATSNHVQKVGRIIGLHYMHRVGKAGVFSWGRVGSAPFGLALAALAYWGGAGLWAAITGLLLFTLRGLLQQVGNTAWWPLVQDNTAGDAVGSYLAHMRLRQRLLELVLPLGVGWYLGAQPTGRHFALPFALALFSTLAGAIIVRGIGERPQTPPEAGLSLRLRQVLATRPMRRYSLFVLARTGITAATLPLWVVVLTGHGLPVSYFVWMTPVTALGYMVGLHAWGRLVDRHGPRATLSITLILQALLALAWLVLPDSLLGISLWAGGVYFVWGALEGGHQMGQSRAMLGAIDKDHQAEGFALAIYASAIGGIAGGALGGALFQWAQGQHLDLLYLTVAQVGLLLPWALSRRLVGYRQQASVRSLFRRSATTS
jgi:hypothetical protein